MSSSHQSQAPETKAEEEALVLFLDDMDSRHSGFKRLSGSIESRESRKVRVIHTYTADQAIEELVQRRFDQVFLDHDLSEEDIMVEVGGGSIVPTGMTVVDYILTMASPPQDIVIHSCNGPAAEEMGRRLDSHPDIRVRLVPFPTLMAMAGRQP